jgi:ATP-dependent exoDNAse (exonuclease V) alpha subunit
MHSVPSLDLNDEFLKALGLLEDTSKRVFITGKAGTGKSTLLDYFRETTRRNVVVLAPTGVAALNVRGVTIHSFFGFRPDITLEKVKQIKVGREKQVLYRKLDTVIIDEVSMVRADLLDCVDLFLSLHGPEKKEPFGGARMVFIGDLYQLPPVVTGQERHVFQTVYKSPYFFDAKVFEGLEMEFVELERVYRQSDGRFVAILNAIRNNSVTQDELDLLNTRYLPDFDNPPAEGFYITLTSTNRQAGEINQVKMGRLKGKTHRYEGRIRGEFDTKVLPTDGVLDLKKGAQVMLLNNDSSGRWVNGTIGTVARVSADQGTGSDVIFVKLLEGGVEAVTPYTWELFNYRVNPKTGTIETDTIGSFTQYPIRLCWAVTIHKSQGKTFDRMIVDIGSGTFAHGQMYVALSRCSALNGLVLKKRLERRHIIMDRRVVKFLTGWQWRKSEEVLSLECRVELIRQAIRDGKRLQIVYLKPDDTKFQRVVQPSAVGELEYLGKRFMGVSAFDTLRGEERNFRVDRILEIEPV